MKVEEKDSVLLAIENAMAKAYSYEEFRVLVQELVAQKATTGKDQSEALIHYTLLNDKRMRRWDKTLRLEEDTQKILGDWDAKVVWLVLTESWCGDAGHSLPVLHKMAALAPGIALKIVLRDAHPQLMDHFLTQGSRSIPKLIAYDRKTSAVLYTWGPRPATATAMVADHKKRNGSLDAQFKEDLQRWYNKDKGKSTIQDLLDLMQSSRV